MVKEEGTVILNITNHEFQETEYWIETSIDNTTQNRTGPIVLGNDETRQETASFYFNEPGDDQKVEFLLFKGDSTQPYLSLRLWVNVSE